MAITKKNFDTTAILDSVYPKINNSLSKPSVTNKWKKCMSEFMSKRYELLYDTMPCDRIYYTDMDRDSLFSALELDPKEIKECLKDTYYWNKEPFKPASAKDPTTIVILCIVRYFYIKKDIKSLELSMIYQSFSGKYYPSIHYGSFPVTAPSKYRHIMEFVVNNKLSQKFDLKSTGSVIGTVKSINNTWIKSYDKLIKNFDDEDVCYIIQQLHNRIKSFIRNIAELYYQAYNDREYITYDKDNVPEDEGGSGGYHLANNDTFKLQQYVEKTMEKLNTSRVEYKVCKMASDANVRTEEIRGIFESIFNNRSNIPKVKEFISCLIATYLQQSTTKEVVSMNFYKFAIQPKPNSKDPLIIRMKELIDEMLDDNSLQYRKRKHRVATKMSYHRAFCIYFAVTIINANKH